MKEAFWGVLIIVLGLFGIVVINVFQNITVDNDMVYYSLKESTEAAAYDAIDLTYYRLNGSIRIVEDKFVENLTRRFAQNVSNANYKITIEDINEMPPKVSLRVETGVSVMSNGMLGKEDPFNIVNRVDAILETKYTKEDLEFIGEEKIEDGPTPPLTGNTCKPTIGDEDDIECIEGDIIFLNHEEIEIVNKICKGQTPPDNISKKVNYRVCECGKWKDKTETLVTSPNLNNKDEWIYEWVFYKEGKTRVINEVIIEKVLQFQCTKGIEIMVPDDIDEVNQNTKKDDGTLLFSNYYEPSYDNSRYEVCPEGGIKIPLGMSFVAHPGYDPEDSVNRELFWEIEEGGENILDLIATNPYRCDYNKDEGRNCFSTARIRANNTGKTKIKVETTELNRNSEGKLVGRGQIAECIVEVYDGKVEDIGCEDIRSLEVGETKKITPVPTPKNVTIYEYTYEIKDKDDKKVAEIKDGNKVKAKAGGTATITITDEKTCEPGPCKTGTCTVKVPAPPVPAGVPHSEKSGGAISEEEYTYKVVDSKGNIKNEYGTYGKAKDKAEDRAGKDDKVYTVLACSSSGCTKIDTSFTCGNLGQYMCTNTYNGMATPVNVVGSDEKVENPHYTPPYVPDTGSATGGGGGGGGSGDRQNSKGEDCGNAAWCNV